MNSLASLMTMIGVERTLVIACGDFGLNKYLEYNDRVFVYFPPDRMLHRHDAREKGKIQHFIESKECTQIVFIGTMDESMIARIKYGESFQSLREALRFNLKLWLRSHQNETLTPTIYNQLLVELHVITQCNFLMDFYFIKERVERKQMKIRGLVGELDEEYIKPIFYNGITYNDIVSMN